MPTSQAYPPSITRAPNGVGLLTTPAWKGYDWLWHGFSTHLGGVSRAYLKEEVGFSPEAAQLNLGFTEADAAEDVRENRLRWIEAITGSRETPLRTIRQVHSNIVVKAAEIGGGAVPEADGIVTNQRGILLGVLTADCIPVLVADPVKRAVGAFHAGWRGTVQRIVELGVARMTQELYSDPADLIAAIGPGIGACCYTVGGEVLSQFTANFSYAEDLFVESEKDLRLNLTEANRRQLLAAGLAENAIATVGGCTSCQQELFYSHRASGGHAGRMMAAIGLH